MPYKNCAIRSQAAQFDQWPVLVRRFSDVLNMQKNGRNQLYDFRWKTREFLGLITPKRNFSRYNHQKNTALG